MALVAPTLFGLAFLTACVGWGRLVACFTTRTESTDPSELAAWGLALLVTVGGLLNLFGAIRPGVLVAGIAIGLGLAPGALRRLRPRPRDAGSTSTLARTARVAALTLIVSVGLLRTAGSFTATTFNPADDYLFYFTLPTKMLQTGSLGEDPFSGRRNLADLGGGHFLSTFVLTFFPHQALNLLDKGVGFLLLLASLAAAQRELGHGRGIRLLGALLLTLLPSPQLNVSILLLGCALLLQLLRSLSRETFWRGGIGEVVPVVVLVAALAVCKTSLLVLTALLLVAAALHAFVTEGLRSLFRLAIVAAGSISLMSPWLISQYRSAGTALFPVLGTGHHSLPPVDPVPPWALAGIVALAAPYVMILIGLTLDRRLRGRCPPALRRSAIGLVFAAAVGTIAIGVATTGSGFGRHPFPALLLVHLLIGTSLLALASEGDGRRRRVYAFAGLALLLPLLAGSVYYRSSYRAWLRNVAFAIGAPAGDRTARAENIAEIQQRVPPGATVLTHLDRPYLLDFRRNRVLLTDYAGTFSLPPGMPVGDGPEALRDYLLAHSIRYVAYAPVDVERVLPLLPPNKRYPWLITTLEQQERFERTVLALTPRVRLLYERDRRVVLDLAQLPVSAAGAASR